MSSLGRWVRHVFVAGARLHWVPAATKRNDQDVCLWWTRLRLTAWLFLLATDEGTRLTVKLLMCHLRISVLAHGKKKDQSAVVFLCSVTKLTREFQSGANVGTTCCRRQRSASGEEETNTNKVEWSGIFDDTQCSSNISTVDHGEVRSRRQILNRSTTVRHARWTKM